MSARNGDRARFHKDRRRKLLHRQRLHALLAGPRKPVADAAPSVERAASGVEGRDDKG
jgi:hypothetical protein